MAIITSYSNSALAKPLLIAIALAIAAVAVVEVEGAPPQPEVSCGSVMSTLAPCFEYVLGGGQVPGNCCNGVKTLYTVSSTTAQRRNVCKCLKDVTGSASAASVKNAEALPQKCGLSIPYKISPSIDCNKVN